MKRLLMIAPAFPPHPSASGHRWRFVARYASVHGWHCDVLTVAERHHVEPMDEELRRLVPSDITIFETGAASKQIARRAGFSDISLRAFFPMRRRLLDLIRTRRPDVVYIPGPPFYQFLLGPFICAPHGVPYVLDYTDPWVAALTPEQDDPRKKIYWARKVAELLEPPTVRKAAHIFAVSDGTNEGIRSRHPEIPASRFSAVPFGFEPRDFEVLRAHPRANHWWDEHDGNIHLVYVGAMLPHGYETLRALFRAVLAIRADDPATGNRLRLHFFGTTYDPNAVEPLVLPTAQSLGLGDVVTEHPRRVPYLDAMNLLTSADVVLALGSSESHYTASKIFPILLSGRPVFAAYHEASSVCEITRESGIGDLVAYSDTERAEDRVPEFAAKLRAAIARVGSAAQTPRLEQLEPFTARATTRHMFDVMQRIAEQNGRVRASDDPDAPSSSASMPAQVDR